MNEREKREAFFAEMTVRGLKKNQLKTPLYRLLWSLGFDIPPPLYSSRDQLIIINLLFAGVFYGFFMWLFAWRESPGLAFLGGTMFGLFFSIFTNFQIEKMREKYGITGNWSDYSPNNQHEADPDVVDNA